MRENTANSRHKKNTQCYKHIRRNKKQNHTHEGLIVLFCYVLLQTPQRISFSLSNLFSFHSMDANLVGFLIFLALLFLSLVSQLLCFLHHRRSNPTPPPRTTVTETLVIIDRLPLFRFSSISRGTFSTIGPTGDVDDDCAICFEQFRNNDMLRSLPCFHAFHSYCISRWLNTNLSCPLCRDVLSDSNTDLLAILRSPPFDSITVQIGNVSLRRETATDLESV